MKKLFSLIDAQQGKEVITRSGAKVTILSYDRKGIQPIVGLIDNGTREDICTWSIAGIYNKSKTEGDQDLVMAPTVEDFFIVFNPDTKETSNLLVSEETAKKAVSERFHPWSYVKIQHTT